MAEPLRRASERGARAEPASRAVRARRPRRAVGQRARTSNAAPRAKPIRLASKSVRCRALQERVLARDGLRGHARVHAARGAVARRARVRGHPRRLPDGRPRRAARAGAARSRAPASARHGDGRRRRAARADRRARRAGGRGRRCASASTSTPAGARSAGACASAPSARPCTPPSRPRRSPARSSRASALRLVGIMAYEAQIAGARRRARRAPAARAWRSARCRRAPRASSPPARGVAAVARPCARRCAAAGVRQRRRHRQPASAPPREARGHRGDGRLGPLRADAVRRLPRVHARGPRRCSRCPSCAVPGRGVVTALGGGYLASGPADAARLPRPTCPRGLRLDRQEGAGEVQTPLLGDAADELAIGDRVYLRHAKAGELCERFASAAPARGRSRSSRRCRPTAVRDNAFCEHPRHDVRRPASAIARAQRRCARSSRRSRRSIARPARPGSARRRSGCASA